MRRAAPVALLLLLVTSSPASAAEGIRTERVQFDRGETSATVQGSIRGYEAIDYQLGARAGQRMAVTLETDNTSNYFNVLPPGSDAAALFIGSIKGNSFDGVLPASGDYRIRVYLMRNAARREEKASYRLTFGITSNEPEASALAGDALVAGTDYHATGQVRCAVGPGDLAATCAFGVKRSGGGSGHVTVTRPDGQRRVIVFEKGEATGYEGGTGAFEASRADDVTTVRIAEERYEIPDAVLFGG